MITEFELHAFVDGELVGQEHAHVLEAAAQSTELHARLDQLRALKKLMRTAYAKDLRTPVKHNLPDDPYRPLRHG